MTIWSVGTAPPARAEDVERYRPPVEAPVVDGFRPPATAYGPGNRGYAYDVVPPGVVRAAGSGVVVFSGQVGGSLHVTLLHPDGLRTSYSFLRSVALRRGQVVVQGTPVGVAGVGFHFGVRGPDGTYLDPGSVFGVATGAVVSIRLVPHDETPPQSAPSIRREHDALRRLVLDRALEDADGSVLSSGLGAVAHVTRAGVSTGIEVGRASLEIVVDLHPLSWSTDMVEALWLHFTAACTPQSEVRDVGRGSDGPAVGHVAVLVGGLGSSSEEAAIDDLDLGALGYRPADTLRFSYAGGRTPATSDQLAANGARTSLSSLPARPYGPEDTAGDVVVAGRRLAGLLRAVHEVRPSAPIDVYAHSLGGIVVRLALLDLAQSGDEAALGTVVTIGTPHDGADLATGAAALGPRARTASVAVAAMLDLGFTPSSPVVRQLAETSDTIAHLSAAGVPDGVDLRTVAARGDVVVTADKADVPGHPAAIVGLTGVTAHDRLPGAAATTTEVLAALVDRPPICDGLVDGVLDAVVPEAVSLMTEGASAAALLLG